uniref:Uncharacterized protein n=1 Tax=Cacopsylla melanoneura TaxID=428564 RepID=A0A8D8VRD8_9HEMI
MYLFFLQNHWNHFWDDEKKSQKCFGTFMFCFGLSGVLSVVLSVDMSVCLFLCPQFFVTTFSPTIFFFAAQSLSLPCNLCLCLVIFVYCMYCEFRVLPQLFIRKCLYTE